MNSIPSSPTTRRATRCLALFLFLLTAVAALAANVFRELDFPAALEAAKQEQRRVVVDFYTTWCGPCRKMDETTWSDGKVVERVGSTAVAIKVDAERNRALAKRYEVTAYPTVLVLAADGTERDRYVGYLAPASFLANYEATLQGRRVGGDPRRAAMPSGEKELAARLERARSLAKETGREAEALEHLLACYDGLAAKNPRIALMIAELGKRHAPALAALRERRELLWTQIRAPESRVSKEQAALLGSLDAGLRDEALLTAGLAAFDSGSPLYRAYANPLLNWLVDLKRYPQALAASDIDGEFAKVAAAIEQAEASGRVSPAQIAELKRKAARGGDKPLELLAGAGQMERARQLARRLLAWDDSAAVRELLAKRLRRAGAEELAAEISPGKK